MIDNSLSDQENKKCYKLAFDSLIRKDHVSAVTHFSYGTMFTITR